MAGPSLGDPYPIAVGNDADTGKDRTSLFSRGRCRRPGLFGDEDGFGQFLGSIDTGPPDRFGVRRCWHRAETTDMVTDDQATSHRH